MTRTIYNRDFNISRKVKIFAFYVKGYKWFSFHANIKPVGFHGKLDDCVCYNIQVSKFALSLLVKKESQL